MDGIYAIIPSTEHKKLMRMRKTTHPFYLLILNMKNFKQY